MPELTAQNVLATLVEALRPIVAQIESSIPVTQGHYDQYMAAITKVAARLGASESKPLCRAIAVAMLQAGANRQGVTAALQALGHG